MIISENVIGSKVWLRIKLIYGFWLEGLEAFFWSLSDIDIDSIFMR